MGCALQNRRRAPPQPPLAPPSTRNVTVYSAAASVELIVNGRSLGTKGVGPLQTWAEWDNVHWAAGNATVRDALVPSLCPSSCLFMSAYVGVHAAVSPAAYLPLCFP